MKYTRALTSVGERLRSAKSYGAQTALLGAQLRLLGGDSLSCLHRDFYPSIQYEHENLLVD